MCPMRYLLAIALPFFMLGLLPRAPHSTQQPGTLVEIHGRVLYPNGEVARGAIVFAFKEGRLTSRVPSGNSDDQGRFVIKRLESGVEYELCSSKQEQGYLLPYGLPFGLSTGGQCKNVRAGAGSEIDIVLAPKSGTLDGQVRDARNRNPISNGKVIVYRPLKFLRGEWVLVNPREATWVPSAEAAVEDNGHFKISGLPTGSYFLKVEVQGRHLWYFNNQVSDTAAQPIVIEGGLTRKIVVSIP
jgi:hypothetical protein